VPARRWRIGVDVGGTFTDLAVLDTRSGELSVHKVPTTPDDPSAGVLDGLRYVAGQVNGFDPADLEHFLHGTTITTNALIQRNYARCALLVTEGHRGAVQVQDQQRQGNLFDISIGHPDSLVDESHVFEVPERTGASGSVVRELDTDAVAAIARRLAEMQVGSVAVCLLFSFAGPAHERQVRDILLQHSPGMRVSLSSDVLPRIREWPRISTMLLNASLEPLLVDYVQTLGDALQARGVEFRRLFLMESNGGLMPFSAVVGGGRAVHTLLSGPAAAVQGAVTMLGTVQQDSLITLDIGGTSADIAFVSEDGALEVTEGRLAGHQIYVPMLDVSTIGAGGGTISRVTPDGRLHVGPDSAGADPGPACYGRGGTLPTTTDADLVLGLLDPGYYLGGRMRIDTGQARSAIATHVAAPLGISTEDAAAAMLQVNDVHMADAIRVFAAQKGIDLATSTLVACGGAGPLHAAAVASEIGIRRVSVPPQPATFSAVGLLCTDVLQDFVQTEITALVPDREDAIAGHFASLERRAVTALETQGFARGQIRCHREVDARYAGQGFELRLEVPDGPAADVPALLAKLFHEQHRRTYGHDAAAEQVEIVSYRVRAQVPLPRYAPRYLPRGDDPPRPPRVPSARAGDAGRRRWPPRGDGPPGLAPSSARPPRDVMFQGSWHATPVLLREDLAAGDRHGGPLIVEQPDTTTFVPPGWSIECDQYGNLNLIAGEH
jgi:N-methylhydantoinase A